MGNPIFSRAGSFSEQAQPSYPQGYGQAQYGQAQYGQAQYGQAQYGQAQYGQYQQGQYGQAPYQQGQFQQAPHGQQDPYAQQFPQAPQGTPQSQLMTFDDVLTKTTISLLIVMAVAAASYLLMPMAVLTVAGLISALVGFVTVLIVSMKAKVSPVGVLVYAVLEGVFIGFFTKIFETYYPGIAVQAVLATFVTAGLTLAAYKFFNIRVTPKMRKMVFIGTAAFAGVMLINFVLAMFGVDSGLRDVYGNFSWIGLIAALLGAGLAVFNLVVDFDAVERGIANRAPSSESWRAALGITVTMVWLYTEMVRILSYLRR